MAFTTKVRNPNFFVSFQTKNKVYLPSDTRNSIYEVSTGRVMGQAAGSFQIVLSPRPISSDGLTWKDLLSPMDYVEIVLSSGDESPLATGISLPNRSEANGGACVMRGYIDNISYSFSISGGSPSRAITITGRDNGKIALINMVYDYREGVPPAIEILQKLQGGREQTMGELDPGSQASLGIVNITADQAIKDLVSFTPSELMTLFFSFFLFPQLKAITAGLSPGAASGLGSVILIPNITINLDSFYDTLQVFNPLTEASDWDPYTPIWSIFQQYQNAPWAELFFDDDNSGPSLTYRTTPWLDANGTPVNSGATPLFSIDIDDTWIMQLSLSTSDQEVVNLFTSQPAMFGPIPGMRLNLGAINTGTGPVPGSIGANPTLISDSNVASNYNRYGLRSQSFKSPYFAVERGAADKDNQNQITTLGNELNRRLVKAMSFNEQLASGEIVIKGTTLPHIGDYARIKIGNQSYTFYLESVQHTMRFPVGGGEGAYTTSLGVSRGQLAEGPAF